MAKKLTKKQVKQIEVRNKMILVLILCVIVFIIYLLIIQAIKSHEAKMRDYKVGVPFTYDSALQKQQKASPVVSNGVKWLPAKQRHIDQYLKPDQLYNDPVQKLQFLNLGMAQKIHPNDLNELLKGKGILENQGVTFSKASKIEDVNEIYLIEHAILETGKGKSQLAQGVKVSDDNKIGKGKKYYNFFGIAAYDHNPLKEGALFAKEHGWDTPEKAIMGGAKFIKEEYLNKPYQDTLYGMRFNPMNPGKHQYATDVMWAHHNAKMMALDYKKLGLKGKYFTRYYYKNHPINKKDLDENHAN